MAINELDDEKLSVDNLSSNITLYSTTVVGDFGYYRLVTDVEAADYDTVAVDVPVPTTGSLDVNSSDDGPNTDVNDDDEIEPNIELDDEDFADEEDPEVVVDPEEFSSVESELFDDDYEDEDERGSKQQ